MRQRHYSSEGVILGRRDYGEADRTLIILSKDYGKAGFIAKGVRKPKSRKRGALEIFARLRFSAARGKSLDIITEAEVLDDYLMVRKNLKKSSVAYFFVEAVGRTLRDEEKQVAVYKLLASYLDRLKTETQLKKLRSAFTLELLTLLGFWPRGRLLPDPDMALENIIEKKLGSIRVGKKLQ